IHAFPRALPEPQSSARPVSNSRPIEPRQPVPPEPVLFHRSVPQPVLPGRPGMAGPFPDVVGGNDRGQRGGERGSQSGGNVRMDSPQPEPPAHNSLPVIKIHQLSLCEDGDA
ncbi:hypothetical protein M9458_018953, partial [Cirrhinus mrigala]